MEKEMFDDTTKKYMRWGLVALIVVGALLAVFFNVGETQGAVASSMAVQLPAALAAVIQVGIIALLTAGFKWVFDVFGLDLRGQATTIGLAISAFVVAELQNIINIIPVQYDGVISTVFYILLLIFAPAGGLYLLAKARKSEAPQRLL